MGSAALKASEPQEEHLSAEREKQNKTKQNKTKASQCLAVLLSVWGGKQDRDDAASWFILRVQSVCVHLCVCVFFNSPAGMFWSEI